MLLPRLLPQDLILIPLLEWEGDEAWRLAELVNKNLTHPVFRVDGKGLSQAAVRGELNLAHDGIVTDVVAECEFSFVKEWRVQMPKVTCFSPWIRKGGDWHIYNDGSLCWEFDLMWRDKIAEVEKKEGSISVIQLAGAWIIHSAQWLLYRHHYAAIHGITTWPSNWPYWRHGPKAAGEQYRELQKQK